MVAVTLLTMPFDRQPVLKDELLELRPLRSNDFAALYAVAADPLLWEQHPEKDRHEEQGFRRFFDDQLESGGALVAIDVRTGEPIGMSRFHGYDEGQGEIEIGWTFLARRFWGGAYNRAMKELMLEHAFRSVRSVVFLIAPGNLRSQHATEKIGAVRDGSRLDGYDRESIVYRIDRATFAGRR